MAAHTPVKVKFESSPAESFMSTPSGTFSPLFDSNIDLLDGDSVVGGSPSSTPDPEPLVDKKVVKKRKSWGQQLPEPKTNLPPR